MAEQRLTERDAMTLPAIGDLQHLVDISDTTDHAGGSSRKITLENMLRLAGGAVFSPLRYGTGTTGVEIQAALDAANTNGGGIVPIPVGTWIAAATLIVYDNTTVIGEGRGTVIKLGDGVNAPLFLNSKWLTASAPEGNHDIVFKHFTIDGNAANNPDYDANNRSGMGICLKNNYRYKIEDIYVYDTRGFGGIYTTGCLTAVNSRSWIKDCYVKDTLVDSDSLYGSGIYITTWSHQEVSLDNNHCIDNAGRGIIIEDGPKKVYVTRNVCRGNGSNGISIVGGDAPSDNIDVFVLNNVCDDNALRGIGIGQAVHRLFINGNSCNNNGYDGIHIQPTAPMTSNTAIKLIGNICLNNGQDYASSSGILLNNAQKCTLIGNDCFDTQTPKTQKYGIYETGTSDYNIIIGNNVDANLTTNLIITGANTIARNNKGHGKVLSWELAEEAWAYATADAPTFTITVPTDATDKYSPGMRIKLTQTTDKYFIITKVAATVLTVYGGTDYTLVDAAITNPQYSSVKAPFGFPLDPTKWTIQTTDSNLRTQATPTQNVWYNLNSTLINIPIGVWKVNYRACIMLNQTTPANNSLYVTLSTANNSESDAEFSGVIRQYVNVMEAGTIFTEKTLVLTTKDTYYLNLKTDAAGVENIYFRNTSGKLIINAICAYL